MGWWRLHVIFAVHDAREPSSLPSSKTREAQLGGPMTFETPDLLVGRIVKGSCPFCRLHSGCHGRSALVMGKYVDLPATQRISLDLRREHRKEGTGLPGRDTQR